jgi:hypothetical protein
MNLEDQLREALRRQDPPEGFAERVIQQAGPAAGREKVQFGERPRRRFRARLGFQGWWPAVSVAAAAMLVFSVSLEYRRVQEERAGRQAVQALQIASEKLNIVRDKVLNK